MLALLDCLPSASCNAGQVPCKAESDAMKACTETDSSHSSPPPVGSAGSGSSGGDASVRCNIGFGGDGQAASGSTLAPGDLVCEGGWESCSDGKTYRVECDATSGSDLACTCQVDGAPRSSFTAASCPDNASDVDRSCGWHLE
jgi:hypothetical protein